MTQISIAMIGVGGVALANHLPALRLCPEVSVAAVCDNHPETVERARVVTGARIADTDWTRVVERDDVQAVIICTPNHLHGPIAIAAALAGKHVLCESPLAMTSPEAHDMWRMAETSGVRHMTSLTSRFVPAMRYIAHLVRQGAIGKPYHFRAQRLQDRGVRHLGWRQQKQFAATGELGDTLSHWIDHGHLLMGPFDRLTVMTRLLMQERGGQLADVEDWVGLLAEFQHGATGVMESSRLATGCGVGRDCPGRCEINGAEGTLVYRPDRPNEILRARLGDSGLHQEPVPREFLALPGSQRDPAVGDPEVVFRYDQDIEFINAIREERRCIPSFAEGCAVQAVMAAAVVSATQDRWVEVAYSAVE